MVITANIAPVPLECPFSEDGPAHGSKSFPAFSKDLDLRNIMRGNEQSSAILSFEAFFLHPASPPPVLLYLRKPGGRMGGFRVPTKGFRRAIVTDTFLKR